MAKLLIAESVFSLVQSNRRNYFLLGLIIIVKKKTEFEIYSWDGVVNNSKIIENKIYTLSINRKIKQNA